MSAPRQQVRTHQRRNASGTRTTVRQHARTGRPRSRGPLLSPRHAMKLLARAWKAGRKGRKWAAAGLVGLAVGEVALWTAANATVAVLGTAALIGATFAVLALSATSVRAAEWGRAETKRRRP